MPGRPREIDATGLDWEFLVVGVGLYIVLYMTPGSSVQYENRSVRCISYTDCHEGITSGKLCKLSIPLDHDD
jgi:hypothetical protein